MSPFRMYTRGPFPPRFVERSALKITGVRTPFYEYDLTWVEEPARRWDYRGLRRVTHSISAAVATGENLRHLGDYLPLIDHGAVDIVQISAGTPGITGAMQVANLAYAHELPVAMMNCPGCFMGHLAACLPNHMTMEFLGAVFTHRTRVEDGHLVLSDRPGLGVEFDARRLPRYAVETPSPNAGPSPRGRRRGAGLFEAGEDEGETERE